MEQPLEYEVVLGSIGFNITAATGEIFTVPYGQQNTPNNDLPFVIYLADIEHISNFKNITYKVKLMQERRATMLLMDELQVNTSEKQSDVLTLSLKGESRARNEAVLDAIVNKFDNDNVQDKQLVARRTLELIDQRFNDLSRELDSIELNKEDYKQLQDLSYIEADAGVSLQRKSSSEQEVLRLETQLSLLEILKRSLTSEDDNNLLAADIGLANTALNTMVGNYNEMARERQKLMLSVGRDHPQLKNLSERLAFAKQNILKSLKPSTRQRFLSVEFDFPAPARETEIVAAESGLPEARVTGLVRLAGKLRALKGQDIEEGVSTRLVVYAATLIANGMPMERAIRAAMIEPLTDDEDVKRGLLDLVTAVIG